MIELLQPSYPWLTPPPASVLWPLPKPGMAMLGFVIGLGTELLTGQGIISQIGLG